MPLFDLDNKLFSRKFPGGIFTVQDAEFTPGHILWVGSTATNATDGAGYGQSPQAPYATLDYAIGQCTADRMDTIYVLPGHSETASTNNQELFDCDVAQVQIIGIGRGTKRPTFNLEHANASCVIGAAGCRVSNLLFVGGVSDLVTCLDIEAAADGSIVDHCQFKDTATDEDALTFIKIVADADDLTIVDNNFVNITGGEATDSLLFAGGSDRTVIARNVASIDAKTGGFINAATAASVSLMVVDNVVVNQDASAGLVYKGHAGTTGLMARNMFAGNKANTEPINTITAMHVIENYMTDTAAASGIVSGTVTAWT